MGVGGLKTKNPRTTGPRTSGSFGSPLLGAATSFLNTIILGFFSKVKTHLNFEPFFPTKSQELGLNTKFETPGEIA